MPKYRTILLQNISEGLCQCGCGLPYTPSKKWPQGKFIPGHNSRVRCHALTLQERLEARTTKTETCWIWNGPGAGQPEYGTLFFNGKHQYVHRLSYALFYAPIPDQYYVCHTCDTPRCWNPAHLFLGTPQDNVQDCIEKERSVIFTNPDALSHKGENNPNASFANADILYIRFLYKIMSAAEIADLLNRSFYTIKKVVGKSTWGHIS